MNYDVLSLQAIQWITWLSIAAGGFTVISTLIFGLISVSALSTHSANSPVDRFALGFVSRKRYMVPVAFTLLASAYGAVTSMDYRATISDTITQGAKVLQIPPKALVGADGTPLLVMENQGMFKHAFLIDIQPIVSVLISRGYIDDPSRANTYDLIEALKQLGRNT